MSRIHLSAPDVGVSESAAVARAVATGWVSSVGPDIDAFETEIASRVGSSFGVAVSSGTAALHLGLLAAGVGHDMVVPTSTFTFAATANAITYTGATPVFVDSDPATGNMDVDVLDDTMAAITRSGARVGAIVPVDIYGKAADYARIEAIAARHGVPVIADSAESLGSCHSGRAAGSFGQAAAVSFNGNKIMTTSGGGMLLTDDEGIAITAKRLATQARQPVAHYEHTEVGYNYRMSNVLAALGRAQLERLDEMIARRRHIRDRYRTIVENSASATLLGNDDAGDNCWLTSIVLGPTCSTDVTSVMRAFDTADIETRRLWKPMHLQPVFRNHPAITTGAAERLFESGLSLPSGSGMSDSDIDRVCDVLVQSLGVVDVPA